ncbi:hypothetical protein Dimus_017612 [Dionaea muscipula]
MDGGEGVPRAAARHGDGDSRACSLRRAAMHVNLIPIFTHPPSSSPSLTLCRRRHRGAAGASPPSDDHTTAADNDAPPDDDDDTSMATMEIEPAHRPQPSSIDLQFESEGDERAKVKLCPATIEIEEVDGGVLVRRRRYPVVCHCRLPIIDFHG